MQGYDLLMLGVMLIAVIRGYSKGLAWQISSIASIFVSYFVAYRFKDVVAPLIEMPDPWRGAVAMMSLFVASSLVIWLLFQSVRGGIEKAKLKDFDQQLGAIFGGVKGAFWCTALTVLALTFLGQATSQHIVNSTSGGYIARLLTNSKKLMPPDVRQVIQPYIEHAENKLKDRVPNDPLGQPFGTSPDGSAIEIPVPVVPGTGTTNPGNGSDVPYWHQTNRTSESTVNEPNDPLLRFSDSDTNDWR